MVKEKSREKKNNNSPKASILEIDDKFKEKFKKEGNEDVKRYIQSMKYWAEKSSRSSLVF